MNKFCKPVSKSPKYKQASLEVSENLKAPLSQNLQSAPGDFWENTWMIKRIQKKMHMASTSKQAVGRGWGIEDSMTSSHRVKMEEEESKCVSNTNHKKPPFPHFWHQFSQRVSADQIRVLYFPTRARWGQIITCAARWVIICLVQLGRVIIIQIPSYWSCCIALHCREQVCMVGNYAARQITDNCAGLPIVAWVTHAVLIADRAQISFAPTWSSNYLMMHRTSE